MNKPAKGFLGKLRRAEPVIEPEPELGADRLAALRVRAAVAEDPCFGEEAAADDGLGPIVLARAVREAGGQWAQAASWFGGRPKLGAIDWPVGSDDQPLPFAAQISLAEIFTASPCNPLPASGSLAFFLGDGAVIHVPEGVTQFTPQPSDTAISACWPVGAAALAMPGDLDGFDAVRAAMDAALPEALLRRSEPFSAAQIDWDGPIPVWWHGVDHLIHVLHLTLGEATSDGQRDSLAALIGALEGFAVDREPWDRLNADEQEVFAEALDNAWQQFDGLIHHPPAPRNVADLATVSILAMMTGDAKAFAALPEPVRETINRDHRLPMHGLPQMFGLGLGAETARSDLSGTDRLAQILLLQLPSDDMLDWHFGDDGVYQFWINAEALAAGNWAATTLTF